MLAGRLLGVLLALALAGQAAPAVHGPRFVGETVITSAGTHYDVITAPTDLTLAEVQLEGDAVLMVPRSSLLAIRVGDYFEWLSLSDTSTLPAGEHVVYLVGAEARPARAVLRFSDAAGHADVALALRTESQFRGMTDRTPVEATPLHPAMNKFADTQPFDGDSYSGFFGVETDWLGLPDAKYRAYRWRAPETNSECLHHVSTSIPAGAGSLDLSIAYNGLSHGGEPMTFEYTRHGSGLHTVTAHAFFVQRAPGDPPPSQGLVVANDLGFLDEYDYGGCMLPLVNRQVHDSGCILTPLPVSVCQVMRQLLP